METRLHPDAVDPAKSISITSRVHDRLRRDILTGTLEPGLKLKIERLRDQYETGASPIREALSLLTSEGLVDRLDQRGFRVAEISLEAFEELLKTRCWLEERAISESLANAGTQWEEHLVLVHHRLTRTERTAADDLQTTIVWEKAHKAFHMALLAACGSRPLLNFCEQLYDQNIRYRYVAVTSAYPKRDIGDEHLNIFQAAIARDQEATVSLLLRHYQGTGDYLKESMRRGN